MNFQIGQRYFNEADVALGLGEVVAQQNRMVQLQFGAVGEKRIYAMDSAPLIRYRPQPGDEVVKRDGEVVTLTAVEEKAELMSYQALNTAGESLSFSETELADNIALSQPKDRLLNAQLDSPKWFQLRQDAAEYRRQLWQSEWYGLIGCRTALLSHQLYIARQVSQRFAPRVLLADEVGLGKTIEAGLIVHAQLLNGLADRVLFLVPDSLVHQWMVELLRRFNIHASVFDEEQCRALTESGYDNPFESAQQVLAPLSLITESAERYGQLKAAGWDLLVVDEAHHLRQPDNLHNQDEAVVFDGRSLNDDERAYAVVAGLGEDIPGMLLLTATPEQLGQRSHFARLRLLDKDRFHDYAAYVKEQSGFEPVAEGVGLLLDAMHNEQDLPLNKVRDIVSSHVADSVIDDLQQLSDNPEKIHAFILRLLDQYGTGRIMFRNTRQSVSGFPRRVLNLTLLDKPDSYQPVGDVAVSLSPEVGFQAGHETTQWTAVDPRIPWLVDTLSGLGKEKVVLIAHHADSVRALADCLREKYGMHAALFHQDMTLLERDQAAAWFADFEQGTNLLLCSEIGSEGRNFQFARHLVLFDLPPHPDLLEQRIGRLDRIGQGREIHLHVPIFENTSQHSWFRWYHEGLEIFSAPNPAAALLFKQFKPRLEENLKPADTDQLIKDTRSESKQLIEAMSRGRDRLLEFQSNPPTAEELVSEAEAAEKEDVLIDFMHRVCDLYGVDYDINTNGSEILRPTEQMEGYFPRLTDEGMTVTYHRRYALANETWHYLTWEHPMITEIMDMVLSQEKGNSTLVAIQQQGLKAGQLFLECHYQYALSGRQNRYLASLLPPQRVRLLLTEQGKDLSEKLDAQLLQKLSKSVPQKTAIAVLKAKLPVIKQLLKLADLKMKQQQPDLINHWQQDIKNALQADIDRLHQLAQHNQLVRDAEISKAQHQLNRAVDTVAGLQPQLDSLRILVTM